MGYLGPVEGCLPQLKNFGKLTYSIKSSSPSTHCFIFNSFPYTSGFIFNGLLFPCCGSSPSQRCGSGGCSTHVVFQQVAWVRGCVRTEITLTVLTSTSPFLLPQILYYLIFFFLFCLFSRS